MQSLLNSNSCRSWGYNEPDQLRLRVRDRIKQLGMEMANIKTAKECFLENFTMINNNIENMTRNISRRILEREETLKRLLQVIAEEKISEWDRQLKLCLQAEKNITNGAPRVSATFSNESIAFINSGDIKLEEDISVVTRVRSFGTLSTVGYPCRPEIAVRDGGGLNGMGFRYPWGVCFDATGRILVADRRKNRIQVFNEFGGFIFHFGKSGFRPGEFRQPSGIAIDKKLRIVVSDTRNHRIQVFTYHGRFLTAFGERGTGVGQFRFPRDVAVNGYCDIAVSETGNRRIQLFTPNGGFVTQFCFGQLNISPWRVAFWGDASLMVIDAQSHRLFTIDKYFRTVNTLDGRNLNFRKPHAGARNTRGRFAVADGDPVKVCDEKRAPCGLVNSVQGVSLKRKDGCTVGGRNSVLISCRF